MNCKRILLAITAVFLTLATPCWAGGGKDKDGASAAANDKSPAVSGLVGLDAALDGAVLDIESKLPKDTPIVVAVITAPGKDARDYIADELSGRFKNLKILAREAALKAVEKEQEFQMSGMVSDESAVGIGHFIGAKAVISGDMRRYADFTQLRVRIVDVESSQAFIYSAKIANNDKLLANILPRANTAVSGGMKVSEIALDHVNRGNDLLAEKKYDDALQEFDRAIAIDGKLAEAYTGRGIAYYWKDNRDRAITEFNQAIRINPNDARAYNGRGLIYYHKSQDGRAIEDFTKAIKIDPNYTEAYYGRGNVYYSREDYNHAIADYTSAIRIDPNHFLIQYVYSSRGDSYEYKEDFDRAISDYTSAIQINSNFWVYYHSRGRVYAKKNDFDRAIADFTSAIQIKPEDAGSYSYRGDAYAKKGDFDRAIADYTVAIRNKPDDGFYFYYRGEAYEKKGDLDRAIADYETAIRLGRLDFLKPRIDSLRKQRGSK